MSWFPNLFKATVEGLGSKRLTAALAGVIAVFLAPVAQKYLALAPDELMPTLIGIVSLVVGFIFSQWHLDAKTGGQTTTAFRLTLALTQAIEKALPEGTTADAIADAVLKALEPKAGESPAAPPPPSP